MLAAYFTAKRPEGRTTHKASKGVMTSETSKLEGTR